MVVEARLAALNVCPSDATDCRSCVRKIGDAGPELWRAPPQVPDSREISRRHQHLARVLRFPVVAPGNENS
jgi:hypothetical protein